MIWSPTVHAVRFTSFFVFEYRRDNSVIVKRFYKVLIKRRRGFYGLRDRLHRFDSNNNQQKTSKALLCDVLNDNVLYRKV